MGGEKETTTDYGEMATRRDVDIVRQWLDDVHHPASEAKVTRFADAIQTVYTERQELYTEVVELRAKVEELREENEAYEQHLATIEPIIEQMKKA